MMSPEKKVYFDKEYIRTLYVEYQTKNKSDVTESFALQKALTGREVLVLAPGRSMLDEAEHVKAFIAKRRPVVISVNFVPEEIPVDFVFISNLRRWENLRGNKHLKVILTSNLDIAGIDMADCFVADYKSLLNTQDKVKDNAGMMLLAFLIKVAAKKIYLAGMDGYSVDAAPNFVAPNMEFHKKPVVMSAMNSGMSAVISQYMKKIPIVFLTAPRYVKPNCQG